MSMFSFAGLQSDQRVFMRACGQKTFPIHKWVEPLPVLEKRDMFQAMWLARNLIDEEVNKELLMSLNNLRDYFNATNDGIVTAERLAQIADDCIDSIYVILALLNTMGIDGTTVWHAVQTANMAKRGPDGNVVRRPDGKILKPAGWEAPDVLTLIQKQIIASKPEREKE